MIVASSSSRGGSSKGGIIARRPTSAEKGERVFRAGGSLLII